MLGAMAHIFVINPVCENFMTNKKYSRRQGIMYAIGFLFLAGAVSVGYDYSGNEANYYSFLGVAKDANNDVIKKAYKTMSLKLHPDKNPAEDATEQFQHLQEVYSILSNANLRTRYERFGPENAKTYNGRRGGADTTVEMDQQAMIDIVMYYVVWTALVYFLLMSESHSKAKMWCYMGLGALLVMEFGFKAGSFEWDLPFFFSYLTAYEKVDIAKRFFPSFLTGCRIIGSYTYVDPIHQLDLKLDAVLEMQRQTMLMVKALVENREAAAAGGAEPKGRHEGYGPVPHPLKGPATGKKMQDFLSQEAQISLAKEKLLATDPDAQRIKPAAQNKAEKKSGITNFLWTIGIIMFFNWLGK